MRWAMSYSDVSLGMSRFLDFKSPGKTTAGCVCRSHPSAQLSLCAHVCWPSLPGRSDRVRRWRLLLGSPRVPVTALAPPGGLCLKSRHRPQLPALASPRKHLSPPATRVFMLPLSTVYLATR